ncbi:thiol reductant ABC exporter subunit CydC [Herbiconiux ginsengi]|uniref:ATP-binding cassette, subfamily C, CydC n=1 Tax=Herbiconiux ginsengi TaxID=381665 RepID=A0A1H3T126_9MICO|nr:thiol reductant ABC exporter subunit CydC [Herbiconiux ginsengi]SDZ43884.1 ATP-binding cassette, subfamily C, CydC [Herbiconiux ginsengi]
MKRGEVIRLAQPRLRRFVPGVVLGLISALCAVGLLATSAYLITKAAEQPPILYLSAAMVAVRAFALGRAAFRYVERLASHDAAFATMPELRVGVYERLVPVSPDGLGRSRRGDLLTRLVSDVDEQQNFPLRVVQPLVVSGLTAVAIVIVVWLLLPAAGLVLLIGLVLAALLGTAVNSWVSGRAERALAGLRGRYQADLADYLGSLDTLVAYGAAPTARASLAETDARLTSALVRRSAGAGATTALVSLIAGAVTVVVLLLGIPSLGQGGFEGPALAVIALVPMAAFEVFGMIPLAWGAWRQVSASAERIASVVPDAVPEGVPVDPAEVVSARREVPPGPVTVRLRDVSARWPGSSTDALAGASVDLAPGDRVLVRGPSGSGKTTLAHVLVRFLDFRGEFSVNGVDVRELPQDEVRRVIGLCEQRPYLFDDDIRQNLLFARDTATDDELLDVLERVGLGDWVRSRGGLTARVGERGALVSGGQAQRLALARALLAGFPVLVLDEPTANVDPDHADALVADLLAAAADSARAVVLISHTPVPAHLVTRTLTLG